MQALAPAAPVQDLTHAECASPTKHKRSFSEFEVLGGHTPNLTGAEKLLEQKGDACGLSTPMPQKRTQLLRLGDMSTKSGLAFKAFPAPLLGCKEVFSEPSSSKDFSAGFSWPANPGNLSPRTRTVPAPLATPQIRHNSKVTPPPAPKATAMPPLLRALHANSIETVRSALELHLNKTPMLPQAFSGNMMLSLLCALQFG